MISTIVKVAEEFEWPVGALMAIIGKQYAGALSLALEPCGADRYTSILLFLHQCSKPVKQQFLVDSLKIDKASMVRMLDYLVERKLIQRSVNPTNRREYLLELSATGKRKIPRVQKEIENMENSFFKSITAAERKQFHKILKQVAENAALIPSRPVSLLFKQNQKSNC